MTEVQTREDYLRQHAERRAAVVELRAGGLSYDEISDRLGGTPNAAKVLMKRARQLGEAPGYDGHTPAPRRRRARRSPTHVRGETTMTVGPDPESITDLVVINNAALTYRARGVLLHLAATCPPETQISADALATDREGKRAMRTVLTELAEHGYLRRGRGTAWVFRGDPTRWTA